MKKWGHTAQVANNGVEALEKLSSGDFDIVLMDIQMPEMGGLEAIRKIRRNERDTTEHCPIIAMTANVLKDDIDACLQAGADEFLPKPVTPDELHDTIEEVYRRCHLLRKRNQPPSVDLDVLRKTFGQNFIDLAPRLAAVVLKEQPMQMSELRKAMQAEDAVMARRIAHTIKGSTAQFRALDARDVAREIETRARKKDLDAAWLLVDELGVEIDRFHEFLRTTDWKFSAVERV